MDRVFVTIGGQPVYRIGAAPAIDDQAMVRDARDVTGHALAPTAMSPGGWASGGNEEAIEAGLPFLGAFAAIILFTIAALVLAKRGR